MSEKLVLESYADNHTEEVMERLLVEGFIAPDLDPGRTADAHLVVLDALQLSAKVGYLAGRYDQTNENLGNNRRRIVRSNNLPRLAREVITKLSIDVIPDELVSLLHKYRGTAKQSSTEVRQLNQEV